MKLAPIVYLRAETEAELLAALARHGANAAVLAGGQSLLPALAQRNHGAGVLVDINRLPHADAIVLQDQPQPVLTLGPLVRHKDVMAHPLVQRHAPLLGLVAGHVGNVAVRNRGTVCGSLAYADPAGEFPLAAIALGARITLRSVESTRQVAADAFFTGAFSTVRQPQEYLCELVVPCATPGSFQFFDEIARRPTAPAIASLALVTARRPGMACAARVVLASAAGQAQVLVETGNRLASQPDNAAAVRAALRSELASRLVGDDASYHLHLACTLLERARAAWCEHLNKRITP